MARRDLSNPLAASVLDGPKNGNGKKMKTLPAKEIKSKGPKSLVLRDGGKRTVKKDLELIKQKTGKCSVR